MQQVTDELVAVATIKVMANVVAKNVAMVVADAVVLAVDEVVWQWLRPWPCPSLKSWSVPGPAW